METIRGKRVAQKLLMVKWEFQNYQQWTDLLRELLMTENCAPE
jgi:hypothetical protein